MVVMPHLRFLSTALVAAAVLGAALAPAAHAAPTTIATAQRAVPVAAWAGTVAWSDFDPATSDYHLVVSRNGAAPQRIAVAPNAVAFDLDLGTNRNGSTYAVYSRCTTPATQNTPPTGCDLYRLSLASAVETKLESLSSPDWDEREPTIFRGQIAFIRNETHGGRTQDVLRIGNTTSGASGTTALVKLNRLAGALTDPELAQSRVAYIRANRNGSQRDVHVRTLRPNGSDKRVYRATSGGANFANVAERHRLVVHVGPHEPGLGHRQPADPLRHQHRQAGLRAGLVALDVDGVGEPGARRRGHGRRVRHRHVLRQRQRRAAGHALQRPAHRPRELHRRAVT
jgi:hypothetical protein